MDIKLEKNNDLCRCRLFTVKYHGKHNIDHKHVQFRN